MTSLRSLGDLLAVVPYLLGFHPTDSLVLLGIRGRRIVLQLRDDLPTGPAATPLADYYAALVARQGATSAVVLGYGPGVAVTPVVAALRAALDARRIAVLDMVRVADGRYWSYLCTEPACCPPDGRRYEVAGSPVAAAAIVEGHVALPSRAALERQLAPLTGPSRAAMTEATDRAHRRLTDLLGRTPGDPGAALLAAGRAAVDDAVWRQRTGGRLTDDEVAWLGSVLVHPPVRDHAWERISGELAVHVGLWTDVSRRVDPELAAAPATLLAFAAWRSGAGAVASIALSRALEGDPDYRLARLLSQALASGLPPTGWPPTGWLPPGDPVPAGDPPDDPSPPVPSTRSGAGREIVVPPSRSIT
jgi:hypothetical protein